MLVRLLSGVPAVKRVLSSVQWYTYRNICLYLSRGNSPYHATRYDRSRRDFETTTDGQTRYVRRSRVNARSSTTRVRRCDYACGAAKGSRRRTFFTFVFRRFSHESFGKRAGENKPILGRASSPVHPFPPRSTECAPPGRPSRRRPITVPWRTNRCVKNYFFRSVFSHPRGKSTCRARATFVCRGIENVSRAVFRHFTPRGNTLKPSYRKS